MRTCPRSGSRINTLGEKPRVQSECLKDSYAKRLLPSRVLWGVGLQTFQLCFQMWLWDITPFSFFFWLLADAINNFTPLCVPAFVHRFTAGPKQLAPPTDLGLGHPMELFSLPVDYPRFFIVMESWQMSKFKILVKFFFSFLVRLCWYHLDPTVQRHEGQP